jgi:hypothetical protein
LGALALSIDLREAGIDAHLEFIVAPTSLLF